jgi:beta-phosphoglucomutase-like phosphatase (HAD superfamily)
MRTRGVALDFDGVVVESVGIKDAAFGEIFSHYPEWPQILEYHLAHNATLRFEKFRHIYVSILGREYSADIESTLTARFSELVCEAIVRCPAVPGATRLLAELGGKLPVFLVSKSPDDELAHILLERHLAQYFDRVYAGSWNKPA